ncbi:MAG: AtpZ/AtpI family protein [Candidatus Margulisiibacteriota bacterium]
MKKNDIGMVYQIGFTLALNLLVFYFIGTFLDKLFHTHSIFLVLGIVFSFFAGLYFVFKMISD